MIKTGIVINIINKKVGIMTSSGEFVYIKPSKAFPKVGQIYTGELYAKNLFLYKYAITAASLMFILISSAYAYAYYTPVTTVVVTINPSVSLEANRWNKVINSKALNSDGSLILENIVLKNKSIDTCLELLVKEAKAENFINNNYVNDKKIISVDIKSKKDHSIDISNFKNIIDSNNLNFKINASSSNNKNIDITVNNKKIDTSILNFNSNKKEATNKTSTIESNPLKKPSIDNNTNINKDKSPKIKEVFKNDDKTIKNEINKSENKNTYIKNPINNNNNNNNNDEDNDDNNKDKILEKLPLEIQRNDSSNKH